MVNWIPEQNTKLKIKKAWFKYCDVISGFEVQILTFVFAFCEISGRGIAFTEVEV